MSISANIWMDRVCAPVGLISLSPLLALQGGLAGVLPAAAAGIQEQVITNLKFRAMTDARGPAGNFLPDAELLMVFGRWLRHTSLDELPELFSALTDDMSLVGPRPLLME